MTISARDEHGNPVDWWFAYKIPKLTKDAETSSAVGYEYLYYDPNISKVIRSPNLLTDNVGALDVTLDTLFDNADATTGWVLYNDEMPPEAKRIDSSNFGHTKGVLAFDTGSKTGFWLLHSWPKFADPHAPEMPTPIYGQTFICISVDMATASRIAEQMISYQEPQVYLPHIPASLDKQDPLYLLTQPLNPDVPGDSNIIECTSRGGLDFKVIAKNKKWNRDFWNDLVGPTIGTDMDVETWIRGKIPPVLDSDGIHKTFDVKYIDLSPIGLPWTWPETHDHAKWGISVDSNWICVGDINRMISQEKRGGGTIAFQNADLWDALSKTDLIVAPPGHSRVDALNLIKETHKTTDGASRITPESAATTKPATARKSATKKAVPRKSSTKKTTARKSAAKKTTAAKSTAKKRTTRKSTRRTSAAKK